MSRPVTLITGAAGGIGSALARTLAGTHDLILAGRTPAPLHALAAEVGGRVLPLDLGQPASLAGAVAGVGRVTNLVHNAGMVQLGAVAEQETAVWQATLNVNLAGPAELTRLLLPALRAERGTVVFVNSTAGLAASAGWASYAASKFGLRALADALRAEEAPHGLRVSTVYPSRTATPMQQSVRAQEGAAYDPANYIAPPSVAATIAFILNAPRDATFTDVTVRPGHVT